MKTRKIIKERLKQMVKRNKFLYVVAMTVLRRRSVLNAGLKKQIRGRRNRIGYSSTVIFTDCCVDIVGDDNEIAIEDYCSFNKVTFLIRGNNNRITISKDVKFRYGGSLHMEDDRCVIEIGAETTFEESHLAVTESGSRIVIGRDCMFAYDIDLRTGDSHSIIDTLTGRRINFAQDIFIDDHVWVGPHCTILKGVVINKNCVVATRSVVSKTFEQPGVILGGSPARILKQNITWDRTRIAKDVCGPVADAAGPDLELVKGIQNSAPIESI